MAVARLPAWSAIEAVTVCTPPARAGGSQRAEDGPGTQPETAAESTATVREARSMPVPPSEKASPMAGVVSLTTTAWPGAVMASEGGTASEVALSTTSIRRGACPVAPSREPYSTWPAWVSSPRVSSQPSFAAPARKARTSEVTSKRTVPARSLVWSTESVASSSNVPPNHCGLQLAAPFVGTVSTAQFQVAPASVQSAVSRWTFTVRPTGPQPLACST